MSYTVYGVIDKASNVVFAKSLFYGYENNKKLNNAKVAIFDALENPLTRKPLHIVTVDISNSKGIVEQTKYLDIDAFIISGVFDKDDGVEYDYILLSDNPDGLFEMLKLKK